MARTHLSLLALALSLVAHLVLLLVLSLLLD
jgi:hypothetical protein